MEKDTTLIGEINFKDIKIKVYNKPNMAKHTISSSWQMRNPDTYYEGILYLTEQNIWYHNNIAIPKQTDREKEMLPKHIITGYEIIDDHFLSLVLPRLEQSYNHRNGINVASN